MAPPLTALIFDVGNVVIHWDPRAAFPPSLSDTDIEEFLVRSDFFTRNAHHDAGKPFAESIRDLAAGPTPEDAQILKYYVDNFAASLTGPVEGTRELLVDLKADGILLFGLTNWSSETFRYASENVDSLELFDDIMVSGVEGIAKPDPEIFRRALARWDLSPEVTGFLDDSLANVGAAQSLGLTCCHFTSASGARVWAREMTGAANL